MDRLKQIAKSVGLLLIFALPNLWLIGVGVFGRDAGHPEEASLLFPALILLLITVVIIGGHLYLSLQYHYGADIIEKVFGSIRKFYLIYRFLVIVIIPALFVGLLFIYHSVFYTFIVTGWFVIALGIDILINKISSDPSMDKQLMDYRSEIASVLIDYFSPAQQFKVVKKDGHGFDIDEKARLVNAENHITNMTFEDDEKIIRVDIRNNIVGKTDEDLMRVLKTIPNNLGIYGMNTVDLNDREGYVTFDLFIQQKVNPIVGVIGYPVGIEVKPKAIPLGVGEDGTLVTVGLEETNLIVGGMPGSGKSGTLTCLLAGVARIPNLAIIGIDPALVELAPWEARLSFGTRNLDCAIPVLQALYDEMENRLYVLRSQGKKKLTANQWTADMPGILIVIDELAKVFADEGGKSPDDKERYRLVRKLVAEGRKAGISVWSATQRPSATLIPTDYRELIQQAIAHATKKQGDTGMILGEGSEAEAHKISGKEKGVGYFVNENSREPRRFRTYLIPDREGVKDILSDPNASAELQDVVRSAQANGQVLEDIVEATAHLRPVGIFQNWLDVQMADHMLIHTIEDEKRARLAAQAVRAALEAEGVTN